MSELKNGRVMKGIGGFYYVDTGTGVYECKARGILKKDKAKLLVGDLVSLEVLDEAGKVGNIVHLSVRKNEMIRPAMANVDGVLLVCSMSRPKPDFTVLDQMILEYRRQHLKVILVFNKLDESNPEQEEEIRTIYRRSEVPCFFVSAKTGEGTEALFDCLNGYFTVLSGNSGVGKSTLLNALGGEVLMETGTISRKIGRGKHTTRHSEIFKLNGETWLADTPGYGRVLPPNLEAEELADYYPEFEGYRGDCRFQPCSHLHEPDCAVKSAVNRGEISSVRYRNYGIIYEELKGKKR